MLGATRDSVYIWSLSSNSLVCSLYILYTYTYTCIGIYEKNTVKVMIWTYMYKNVCAILYSMRRVLSASYTFICIYGSTGFLSLFLYFSSYLRGFRRDHSHIFSFIYSLLFTSTCLPLSSGENTTFSQIYIRLFQLLLARYYHNFWS